MSKIQPPQFLSDLYRDLRDRRMLLPVAALIIAIAVVPIGLAKSTPEAVPPPPVAEGGQGAAEPAVLASDVGVRDYKKRLEQLKSSNPFDQKFSAPPPESVAIGIQDDPSAATTETIDPAATSTETATSTTPSTVDPGPPSTVNPGPPTQPPAVQDPDSMPEPAIRYYSSRVDVTIGPLGETKAIEGARALDMLPNEKRPVALFVGITETGDSAIFLLAPYLTAGEGEGSCSPKPVEACEFLTLKEGESRILNDPVDGTAYRLGVNGIHLVRIPAPAGLESADGSRKRSERAVLGAGL